MGAITPGLAFPLLAPDGSAAAASYAFAGAAGTGTFRNAAAGLAFSVGGTERAQFDSSGHLLPFVDATYDCGQNINAGNVKRWRNIAASGQIVAPAGTSSAPGLTIGQATGSAGQEGFYTGGSGNLSGAAAGVEAIFFSILGTANGRSLGVVGNNGNKAEIQHFTELVTLDTGAAFTDSPSNLLPANSIILCVGGRVTTTITTALNWRLGDPTTSDRFTSANATLAAGTTDVGLRHMQGSVATDAAGPVQTAAAKVRITLDAPPGAGAVRVFTSAIVFTAPTS